MNTIIYGGAFNPPHLGHQMIITEILSQKIADRIIIVPSGKRRDKTSYAVTDKNRLGMLEYLIKDIDNKNISVDSSFLSVPPEQGSTVVLHKYYTKKFGKNIPQVFGSDTVAHMSEWFEGKKVMHEIPKIIILRPDINTSLENLENYQTISINFPENIGNLSSTLIREKLKNGNTEGLSLNVAKYIKKYNLYI